MASSIEVLDLFSAAAGGWSLGMHRAGFKTIAACEFVDWRRALYQQNNPEVRIYDDVRTLTADQLLRDFGRLPAVVVGSPPCQDISSANTKGKGVEGERSGLYFQAIRIIGEVRPRWFALENSSNLRTRGADAVLAAMEAIGYACWPFVVRAGDIGANHERPRCWIIGCDLDQVADAGSRGQWEQPRRWHGSNGADPAFDEDHDQAEHASYAYGYGRDEGRGRGRIGVDLSVSDDPVDAESIGHEGGRSRRHGPDGNGSTPIGPGHVCEHGIRWPWACDECDQAAYAKIKRHVARTGDAESPRREEYRNGFEDVSSPCRPTRNATHADQAGQADGCVVSGLRQEEVANDGCGSGRSDDRQGVGQVAVCEGDRFDPSSWRSDWSLDDLARRVLLDARIQAWTFVAFLLDEGGQEWAAEQLIAEAKSAGFAAKLSLGSDLRAALRTVLASYGESTAHRLAPIAETMSAECSITFAPENSWDFSAKSAEEIDGYQSTTSTKSGLTTKPKTSKRSALRATPSTTSEQDLKAVHRRAERRFKQSASRLVEAFGDAVVPQIPEAIGRAILRTERALAVAYGRVA